MLTRKPVVREIDGTRMEFPPLTIADWIALGGELRKQQLGEVESAARAAVAAGLDTAYLGMFIRDCTPAAPAYGDLLRFVITVAGARALLLLSLRRANPGGAAEDLERLLDVRELTELAQAVAVASIARREEEGEKAPV